MRRNTWWALSTLSAVVLLFGYHTSTSGPSGATAATTTTVQSGSFASSGSGTSSSNAGAGAGSGGDDTTPTPSASPTTAAAGTNTSRTVAGSVAQTRWGPVQVQVTIVGGKITRASVLQYPQNNGRDIEINDQALPILTRETVAAQSADIDMVSGATYTSDGYVESLQSALDQAGL